MDLKEAAESSAAKVSSRFVVPALVGVLTITLAVIGFFWKKDQDASASQMAAIATKVEATAEKTSQIDTNVRLLSQRVDNMLIRQVDTNAQRLDNHEQRIETIERSVRVP